ncbi:phage portal protein [Streptomyces parvulus]|uniref:phage portal protein n=1 Tax=Streptomyces parvulus TaxID=146923 RepID=UPI003694710F
MTDLTIAVNEILDRRADYETAEDYYYGTADEVFTSKAVYKALKHTAGEFRLNFAAVPVDTVNNRLEITSVSAISEGAGQYLDRVWATDELQLDIAQVHKNALIYGDAYLMVLPDGDSLQVHYNSPKTTIAIYDEENPKVMRFAAKVWEITVDINGKREKRTRVNLYYPDRWEKYISRDSKMTAIPQPSEFEPFVDEYTDANGVMANPLKHKVIPVFHFRTEMPEGKPEHIRAYGPQDAINKFVVTQMAANDFHGFPQRWALTLEGTSESADFDDETETVGVANQPGSLAVLKGIKSVGQFDAANPATFIDPMRVNIRAMATVTATPLHYFEPTGNVPSGEALRVAEAPLVKKTKMRQLSFGSTWRKVFSFILEAQGMKEDVQIHWRAVETFDTKEAWEIARIKKQVGLPDSQNLVEMGYDAALVEQWAQEAAQRASQGRTGVEATPVQPADTAALETGAQAGEQTAA